jgi:hypothetical protein
LVENFKELEREALHEYNQRLVRARFKHDETIKFARQAEKQAFIDAHLKIENGNARLLDCKDRLERATIKFELRELVREEEKRVIEAAEATRKAIRQSKEDEEREKEQAKLDYGATLKNIDEIKKAKGILQTAEREAHARERQEQDEAKRIKQVEIKKGDEQKRREAEAAKQAEIEAQQKKQEAKKFLDEQRRSEEQRQKADREYQLTKKEEERRQKEKSARLIKENRRKDQEEAKKNETPAKIPDISDSPAPVPVKQPIPEKALEAGITRNIAPAPRYNPIFEGTVNLVISAASECSVVRTLENSLNAWPDVKLVLTGGEDSDIKMILSVSGPVDLVNRLSSLPVVETARAEGEQIRVSLKSNNLLAQES